MTQDPPSRPTALKLAKGSFGDVDQWREAVLGWDLDFQQLDRGPLIACIELTAVDGLAVQHVSLNRRFHQAGAPPQDAVTFAFADEPQSVRWFGADCLKNGLQNFSLAKGFESVSERDHAAHTISIPTCTLLGVGKALGCDLEEHQLTSGPEQFQLSEMEFRKLKTLVLLYRRCLHTASVTAPDAADLVADIQSLLVLALSKANEVPALHGSKPRYVAVSNAVELIRTVEGRVTLPEVCERASVSARTLSRGFTERFGVSTKQYIVATRLAAARRRLLATGVSVTEAAHSSGFWHLGRFAQDYRRTFGESPSETKGRATR